MSPAWESLRARLGDAQNRHLIFVSDSSILLFQGCLGQRYGEELAAEMPEVDMVVGFQNYGSLAPSLRAAVDPDAPPIDISMFSPTGAGGMSFDAPLPVNTNRVQVGSRFPHQHVQHPAHPSELLASPSEL
jgi:tRNA A37 methylthiotransferase MiaB